MDGQILRARLRHPCHGWNGYRNIAAAKPYSILLRQSQYRKRQNDQWLHAAIVRVAGRVLGIDYLEEEVRALAERGYRVMALILPKPIHTEERFDVIVLGNIIEHLSNFKA